MSVQLIAHTPEPERLVAAAAKLCYSNVNMQEVLAISGEDAAAAIDGNRKEQENESKNKPRSGGGTAEDAPDTLCRA